MGQPLITVRSRHKHPEGLSQVSTAWPPCSVRSTSLNGEPLFVNAWEMKSKALRISPIYFTQPPFMKPLALILTACLTFLLLIM